MRRVPSLPASLVALTALAVLLLWPSTAQAATQVDQYRFQGTTAGASFSSFSGCLETSANVYASLDQSTVYVNADQYDFCTGSEHYFSAIGVLPPGALKINSQLTSGSLVTSIPSYDQYNVLHTITVNLSWTGTGALFTQLYHTQTKEPPYTVVTVTENGSFRAATASGSISDGVVEYASSPGYANGDLSSLKYGLVSVTRS